MKLSRRAYAQHRGISEKAVRKAIASGRITLEPDGTIDPVKADREWDLQTDPVKRRGSPTPRSARKAVDDTLAEAGPVGPAAFMRARAAREMIGAQASRLGLTIDAAEAVRAGTAPDALRRAVLEQLAKTTDATIVASIAPPPAEPAPAESPLIAAAKAVAANATT